jgi:hypothetical protein
MAAHLGVERLLFPETATPGNALKWRVAAWSRHILAMVRKQNHPSLLFTTQPHYLPKVLATLFHSPCTVAGSRLTR